MRQDVAVDENDADYKFWFKVENLKIIPGTYDVEVSSKNISRFKNSSFRCGIFYCFRTRVYLYCLMLDWKLYYGNFFVGRASIGRRL